jgi:hypothetical protein
MASETLPELPTHLWCKMYPRRDRDEQRMIIKLRLQNFQNTREQDAEFPLVSKAEKKRAKQVKRREPRSYGILVSWPEDRLMANLSLRRPKLE